MTQHAAAGPHESGLRIHLVGFAAEHRAALSAHLTPELVASIHAAEAQPRNPATAFLPGSFNPLHFGHLQMKAIAEQVLGCAVGWELSLANVDKPLLPPPLLAARLVALHATLAGQTSGIWCTLAATFVEKSLLFPGATFVVGADTAERLADPRYYRHSICERDQAIDTMATSGTRFLVFGRQSGDRFVELADLNLPAPLMALCRGVPASAFRADVSSTELRRRAGNRL